MVNKRVLVRAVQTKKNELTFLDIEMASD
jgi:hypothetical protein